MKSPSQPYRKILIFCGLLMFVIFPALSRAQTVTEKSGVEFSCLVWDPLPMPEIFYLDGNDYLPLVFSLGNRSQPYPLKQATAFELYVKDAGEEGGTSYKLVGKAPLVTGSRQMLLVIIPAMGTGALPLRLMAVDDSMEAFPPGSFKFLNFSKDALQVKFGGQIAAIRPGEIRIVNPRIPEKGGFMPFMIGDTQGKIVFETRLFGQPTGREMVFIGNASEPERQHKVMFLTQVIPPAPQE
jgi:hypothetical protein